MSARELIDALVALSLLVIAGLLTILENRISKLEKR